MMTLSGDWNSYYRYSSTGRGDDFWGQHRLHATQDGNKLTLQTGLESASQVRIELELSADGKTADGTWHERTEPNGFYQGKEFEGTISFKIAGNGERMNGIWHGVGTDGAMNSDIWELARAKESAEMTERPTRWKFTHWYPSNNHDGEDSDEHEVKSHWSGSILVLESLPKDDGSYMLARLLIQDGVAAGSWYESASLTGEYAGAQYSGAGQLIVDPKTHRMEGLWAGAGYDHELKKMRIYTGRWEITPIDAA